jgi:Ca-activated chloride channel homolog
VQRLLCGRPRARTRVIACLIAVSGLCAPTAATAGRDKVVASIQITSPLGRSGLPGKVRIVARITLPPETPPPAVRFMVDGALLGTDVDGPPYAMEWEDVNPFERCRLAVEVEDGRADVLRDEVELLPFEIVETADVMSVGVDATVQDAKGRFVSGLDASRFQVLEDGIPQALDTVTAEAEPAIFALLVDTSQSMSKNIELVRTAAGRLPMHLREVDTVAIAPFRKGITTVTGPTRDPATIMEAVAAIKPAGGTAIMDALQLVTERFGDGAGRRVVVLVTDGYDEHSTASLTEAMARLKASQVTVYVIAIGGVAGVSLQGERLLRQLAAETGGRAFFPWNQKELADAHAAIADDVQHRYRIIYTPANQRRDGTWRTIEVVTGNAEHRLRARPGYFAPAPLPVRPSLEFTAVDETQQYVELTVEDLEIIEDGVAQTVDVFNEAVAPVSIMLALDGSGSMRRSAPAVRKAANVFVNALRPTDPLGLVMFADKSEMVHDLGTRRDESTAAVAAYKATGGTALYDALGDAILRLKTVEGRRAVVVVTDGHDENAKSNGPGSTRAWDEVLHHARESDVTVYAIGLGSRVDRTRLEQLAAVTGGEAYFTTDVAELERQYRRIVEELRRRYVVAYTSTNSKRNGQWRKVEIRGRTARVRIRSRGGYFAPAQ